MAIVGEIRMLAGNSPTLPYGWTFCDGRLLSRSDYGDLFNVIGTAFNAADTGPKDFNVPDLRARVVVGWAGSPGSNPLAAGLTLRAFASKGGEETHILNVGEIASHTHSVTDPGHTHGLAGGASFVTNTAGTAYVATAGTRGATAATTASATTGITLGNQGSGVAHNNMQPFIVLDFIIRTRT